MKPRAFVAILTAFLAVATTSTTVAASSDASYAARIGERPVSLPILPGFTEPDDSMSKVRDVSTRALPANYRLVGLQVPQDYLDKVHAHDRSASLSRYCIVVTYRNFEASGMPPTVLAEVKRLMRDQGDKAMKLAAAQAASSSDRMSTELGKLTGDKTATISVGDYKSLGVFDEGANSIALATINPVNVSSAKLQSHYDQITALAFVLIHGKPVAANFYADYTSKSDIDWAESQARAWIRRVNELNP